MSHKMTFRTWNMRTVYTLSCGLFVLTLLYAIFLRKKDDFLTNDKKQYNKGK